MSLSRFKECGAAFGAEKRRWPPHDQALYDQFARTPEGLAILAEASRTDEFLDALKSTQPNPGHAHLIAVLAVPLWRRFAMPMAALAVCAVLGFVVGYWQTISVADANSVAQILLGPQSLQEVGL